jgi:membrane protease subunit (stomatin/prohibitin family)
MALIDLVKCDAVTDAVIVEKFCSEHLDELRIGTQMVVNQSQEAILVKGGIALDTFGPGTHTITTGNIPLLRKVVNSVFGNRTPFTAEVWYVNRTVKRDLQWGTPKRIAVMDPQFQFPVNVGAFGQWGFRIEDSRSFVTQVVGTQLGADSDKIYRYFIGEIVEKVSRNIAKLVSDGVPITSITSRLSELSTATAMNVAAEFARFGVELVNFSISSISIAPEEMKRIQDVMAKRMEMNILGATPVGQGFIAAKSLEIMQDAARNQSAVGGIVAASTGLGLGLGAAMPAAQQLAAGMAVPPPATAPSDDPAGKLLKLKSLLEGGLITQAEYESKRAKIIDAL